MPKYTNKSAGRFFELINKSDISEGEYQEVAGLLDKDRSLISEVYLEDEKTERLKGNQPLHIACKKCDLRLAKMILDRCSNQERAEIINQPNLEQITPLYYTCVAKDFDGAVKLQLAKMLLENKANPEFLNIYNGHTPKTVAEKRNPPIKALIDEIEIAKAAALKEVKAVARSETKSAIADVTKIFKAIVSEKKLELQEQKEIAEKVAAEKLAQEQKEKEQNKKIAQSKILAAYNLMRQEDPQLEINFTKGGSFKANAKDKNGNNLLHHVCNGALKKRTGNIGKDLELVEILVAEGVDLNHQNINENTPLAVAAKIGYNEMVQNLVKNYSDKIDYSLSDKANNTSLHAVCHACSPATAKLLIEEIPQNQRALLNKKDNDGSTPFLRAARSKNFAVVEAMLDYPEIKLNEINRDGCSIMHYLALGNNDPALVDKVTRKVASEDLPALMGFSNTGYNPMHLICVGSKAETHEAKAKIAEIFLQHGCAFNLGDGSKRQDYPLHIAAACANGAMVQLLLAHNANVNVVNASRENPLHSLAMSGPEAEENNPDRVVIAKMLLAKGCELTALNQDGLSAFNYVANGSALIKEFDQFFQQIIIKENKAIDQKCDEMMFERWLPQRLSQAEVGEIILGLFDDLDKEDPLIKERALGYLCLKQDFDKISKFYERQIEMLNLSEESADKSQKLAVLLESINTNEEMYRDQLGSVQLIHEKYPQYILPQESEWKNLSKKEMGNFFNKVTARLMMDLIESGADVNKAVDIDGSKIDRTPLLLACEQGNFLAAQIIAPHVRDLNRIDENGNSALHYCAAHNNRYSNGVFQEIMARGQSSFDLINSTNESAIQIACQMSNHDLAKDLITAGAKFKMSDVADILKDMVPDQNERRTIAVGFLSAHAKATATTNSTSAASASQLLERSSVQKV